MTVHSSRTRLYYQRIATPLSYRYLLSTTITKQLVLHQPTATRSSYRYLPYTNILEQPVLYQWLLKSQLMLFVSLKAAV